MRKHKILNGALLRAVGVVSAMAILVTGVTFAALQSQQAVLTGNTIQSATADLRIGTTASNFGTSQPGFTFTGVVPGGPAAPVSGNTVYVKNFGGVDLSLKLSISSVPTNTNNVDLSKVNVQLTRTDVANSAPQTASLQSLMSPDGGLALKDSVAVGAIAQYAFRISMASDAFSGSSASIGAVDFVLSGTAVSQ